MSSNFFNFLNFFNSLKKLECVCCQNENEQAEDGVELGEHGEHHCRTESVVTCADSANTVGTNLSLTDGAEESHEAKSQTYTEDGASCGHCDFGCHFRVQHEEADETVQTLRRGQSGQAHVGTASGRVLLESTDSGITADGYAIGTSDTRQGYAKCYTQIS